MGLSILSSCALVLAVLGPTANPENQFRQFWGMQFDVAERCVKAGFNLLTSAKDPNEAGEFARWLPFCETNGVDFAPMLLKFYKNDKVDGKTLKERYPRVDAAGRPRKGAGADATAAGDYLAAKADRWGKDYARRYGRQRAELHGHPVSQPRYRRLGVPRSLRAYHRRGYGYRGGNPLRHRKTLRGKELLREIEKQKALLPYGKRAFLL